MWHGPLFTLENMAAEMSDYVEGHISVNYFWGRIVEDPGLFFYPVAYLFRTTPATLLGLLAMLFCFWRWRWPFERALVRRSAVALGVFAIVFMAGMTLGGKKFDRYLLPIFPMLDVLAALGWIGVAQLVVQWWQMRSAKENRAIAPSQLDQRGLPVVLGVTLLLHGIFGFVNYPEYLTYYNPLLGGSATAPQVLMVGWGEGLDEAADWLNQQPGAENLRIASTYGDGPLSYFLKTKQPVQSFWTPDFWFDSDYAVLYVNQWQRSDIIRDIVNYFSEQTPAHVVRLHGLELARIYAMRIKPPPPFSGVYIDSAVNFANKIRLAGYSLGTHTFLTGDHLLIRLYLKSLAAIDKDYIVSVRLVGPDGAVIAHHEGTPGGEPASGWPLQAVRYDYHEMVIPSDAPSGTYQLTVALYDPATPNIQLPVGSSAATRGEHSHTITTIQIRSANSYAVNAQWNDVQLTELQHEPRIKPDQPFFVDATATGKVDGSLKLSMRLLDQAEQTVAQADTILSANMRLELALPADAAPGTYTIAVVVYDPKTLAPQPDQAGQFTTNLSKVEYVK
ncbi:MAG: hypothetical protein NT075_04440 [Chloroflexi bacterium]|nr:hypothetical protein [Chloroflexota bacterium]